MKLKFKQSVHLVDKGTVNTHDVIEFDNKLQAESLVEAGYADVFVEEETEVKPVVKPKQKRKPKATEGDE